MVFLLGPIFFEMTWKYLDPDFFTGFFLNVDLYTQKNPGFLNPLLVSNSETPANPIAWSVTGSKALVRCTGFQEFITTRGSGGCRGGRRHGSHSGFELHDESGNTLGDSLMISKIAVWSTIFVGRSKKLRALNRDVGIGPLRMDSKSMVTSGALPAMKFSRAAK